MIIGFGAAVIILLCGDFLQESSANLLEDGTINKNDKNNVALEKDMKDVRSVTEGTHFYRLKSNIDI